MPVAERLPPTTFRALHNLEKWGKLPYIYGLRKQKLIDDGLADNTHGHWSITRLGRKRLKEERIARELEKHAITRCH